MAATAAPTKTPVDADCWRGFAPGTWRSRVDVRDFIVHNVTSYPGDEKFLVGPSKRTLAVWEKLQPYFAEERKKGVLAVDAKTPSTVTAHKAGYIDRPNEVIVGLQTDQPFKRAIFPYGGLRMVEAGLKASGFEADPQVHEAFTKYRKSHNDGVFDAYTPEIVNCRRSGIITGLPDAYGRGRIIGDYRRVALYGIDRLLAEKKVERAQLDDMWPTDEVIRQREEMAEQMRALQDLAKMAKLYECDITKPAATRARPCNGPISPTSAPSRKRTGPRCRSAVSRASSTSSSSAICAKVRSMKRARRSSGTNWCRSCVSYASSAPRSTTRC
jgi:formate C-acetyltransferase